MVLSKASSKTFAVKAEKWSDSAHRFLKQCVNSGNAEACYTLGMVSLKLLLLLLFKCFILIFTNFLNCYQIRFYCLQNRESGASLMAKAAMKSHAPALYSLAVIQFNGSGGSKSNKDLRAGVALCARAAYLGHIDALRELGHCLQDGYGVRQNIAEGRRLLVQANARELAAGLRSPTWWAHFYRYLTPGPLSCPLLSDFGCSVPEPELHPANKFLKEWFGSGRGLLGHKLRLCAHGGCGRPETRPHEFRRCSVCGKVNYCSRGCQALDWKLRHKGECIAGERWLEEEDGGDGGDLGGGEEMVEVEEDGIGENVFIG